MRARQALEGLDFAWEEGKPAEPARGLFRRGEGTVNPV